MTAAARIREPLYPIAYAAMLVGLDSMTARRWARGYAYGAKDDRKHSQPVVAGIAPAGPANENLTFEELLTLRMVRAFRGCGLGLPTIKKAARVAAERYQIGNPFVSRAFRTDGRQVFIELENAVELTRQERVLIHALTGQQEFKAVVEPSLFQDVVFVGDMPGEWFPIGRDHAVVIRPDRALGAPHVQGTGVRTDVIFDAVEAEGGDDEAIAATADWFKLSEQQVRDAVTAEAKWRTPAAA